MRVKNIPLLLYFDGKFFDNDNDDSKVYLSD